MAQQTQITQTEQSVITMEISRIVPLSRARADSAGRMILSTERDLGTLLASHAGQQGMELDRTEVRWTCTVVGITEPTPAGSPVSIGP